MCDASVGKPSLKGLIVGGGKWEHSISKTPLLYIIVVLDDSIEVLSRENSCNGIVLGVNYDEVAQVVGTENFQGFGQRIKSAQLLRVLDHVRPQVDPFSFVASEPGKSLLWAGLVRENV